MKRSLVFSILCITAGVGTQSAFAGLAPLPLSIFSPISILSQMPVPQAIIAAGPLVYNALRHKLFNAVMSAGVEQAGKLTTLLKRNAEGGFGNLKVDVDLQRDIESDLQPDVLDDENAPEHRAIDFAIENLHQRHPDALEDEEICYGIKNLFRWNQGQKRDAIENPKVNYAFRHLFEEPIEDDSFGLETLFAEDEDDEDAPEYRAIDFAIENLYQRNNEESWKTLIVSHLTSKAAKVTGAVAATALVATGVYKYVRSLQAKKASDVSDKYPNAEAVGA